MDDTTSTTTAPEAVDNLPVAINDQKTADTTTIPSTTAGTAGTPSNASPLQQFTDRALKFLSHASNETLGACLVGLGASTYFILGRVGLVVIGVAGGVVLHATWEGIRHDDRDEVIKTAEKDKRREAGIEVAKRLLDWRNDARTAEEQADSVKILANQALDFSSFGPETAAALNTFTDAVIKDYVHYWYDSTLPEEGTFPMACRRTFTAFILSFSGHLQRKRPADAFLDFVTNASSIIIVLLNELSVALNASPNSTAEEAIASYLKMKPDCSLSYMVDQNAHKAKLAESAEDIIQAYLDPKSYNCPPAHAFLKQVMAQLVLGSTVTLCSRPEWINEWIVYGLEESETTKEVMNMVDAGVEGRAKVTPTTEQQEVKSKNESVESKAASAHKRKMSRAEEAMDEAMKEAQRLTQLMIEEDRRRAEEESGVREVMTASGDISDSTTQGVVTPTSSQSDRERKSGDVSAPESPFTEESTLARESNQFTSFDQLVPQAPPTALADTPVKPRPQTAILTLLNANISIFDDSVPGERTTNKAKPTLDYLIQIEPANSIFPGWMIARKYADFETLHEVLRRISVITGVRFVEAHAELPKWRGNTKANLRADLEKYLTDAVRYQPLAESEGMKRFLEKDQGLSKSPSGAVKGFGWPTPDAFGKLGGDMMNVLTKAPKQVAGGGKAVLGGVAGLVGGSGKKANQSQTSLGRTATNPTNESPVTPSHSHRQSTTFAQSVMTDSYLGSLGDSGESEENSRIDTRPTSVRRGSGATTSSFDTKSKQSPAVSRPGSIISQRESVLSAEASPRNSMSQPRPSDLSISETINLPPPPSEMPADYGAPAPLTRGSTDTFRSSKLDQGLAQSAELDRQPDEPGTDAASTATAAKVKAPLSERETSAAVELMFAVITELYTLSGAWQIRRTLLTAAKTFLLRPGNPQLSSIRDLLQSSLLDSNLSDSGIAHQVYKMRENGLPTEEELKVWKRDYPEKTAEQKEELRIKARKLLVSKGMPQALTSVMGAAASGEALGKVFDCLQVPEISRGLIFGLMLQALRVVTD